MVNVQIITDCSVLDRFCFYAQFACFDETIDLYQWIKPWKSYTTVDTMQKKYELVRNSTQSSDLLYYTNGSYRAFC